MRYMPIVFIAATLTVGCTRKDAEATAGAASQKTTAGAKPQDAVAAANETTSVKRADGRNRNVNRTGTVTDWTTLSLSGKKLDLIHDSVRQTLVFNPEGDVMAIFGTKGGPETAPILFWKIKGSVLILSSEEGSPAILELREPYIQGAPGSVFGRTLSVVGRNGEETLYKLSVAEN